MATRVLKASPEQILELCENMQRQIYSTKDAIESLGYSLHHLNDAIEDFYVQDATSKLYQSLDKSEKTIEYAQEVLLHIIDEMKNLLLAVPTPPSITAKQLLEFD